MTSRFSKLLIFNLFLLLEVFFSNSSFAHDGGHYTDKDVFNVWTLKNGQRIEGNFLSAKPDSLLLEQAFGKTFWVALKDLQTADLRLAQFKIKKIYERKREREKNLVFLKS